MTPRFAVVIFDNDGVLVDSEPVANTILAELLQEYGVQMTAAECTDEFLGASLGRVRAVVEARVGTPLPPDFESRYQTRLLGEIAVSLRPVPGVDALLSVLAAAGVSVWVASSSSRERIRAGLEATGLGHWFDGRVVSVDDVVRGKPAPDLFLRAASLAGMPPEACAVIEDSALGVEAAAAAGMTAFGYAGRTPAASLSGAATVAAVVDDMAALRGLLGV